MALTKINGDVIEANAISSTHLASGAVTHSSLSSITTDNVSEGSTNLYHSAARARSSLSVTGGYLSYDSGTGVLQLTSDSIRGAISVTDAGGDGSLAYSAGVITYTGPSASEVRAHFSAGTGINISSGQISTSQDISTSATPTFGNITTTGYIAGPATFTIDPAAVGDNTGTVVIAGNLQVDGTTTTINSTTMTVDDLNIVLASGAANAAAANGAGITVDGASATITYDATNDEWDLNKSVTISGSPQLLLNLYRTTSTPGIKFTNGGATGYGYLVGDNDEFTFGYNDGSTSTAQLKIDSSGNVGIGVTPLAWNSGNTALQVGPNDTSIYSFDSGGDIYLAENVYRDSAGDFISPRADVSSIAGLSDGQFIFYGNPAVASAGDAATLSERFRITNTGEVGIGTQSPTLGKLQVEASSFSGFAGRFNNSGTGGGNHGLYVNTNSSSAFLADFRVGGDTKHFLSGDLAYFKGNVGIGATSPDVQLEIAGASGTSSTLKLSGRPDWTSGSGQYNVGNIYGENLGAGVVTTRIKIDGDDTDGAIEFFTSDTGSLRSVMYMSNNGTTAVPMIRANGWYTESLNTVGGPAMEIGFTGAYAYCLGYDRNAAQYKNVMIDGYTVGFATSGNTRAELLNDGFHPYANATYTLGQETGNSWKQLFLKHSANTGETSGIPDVGKTTTGGMHFTNNGSGTSTGITWEGGDSNTQAGIVCHHNNSDGTHLGFFTTYTYAGGPQCRMKLTNYGTLILGVQNDIGGLVSVSTAASLYTDHGDIICGASNNDIMLSDLLPGYSRGAYGNVKSSANYIYFSIGNSYVSNINSSGTYGASDARLKTNVATITGALDKVNQLRGVTFNWIDETRGTDTNIGMIAQEVETVVPELVDNGAGLPDDDEGNAPIKGVNYAHMTSLLVEAIKELKTENDALKARVEALEG